MRSHKFENSRKERKWDAKVQELKENEIKLKGFISKNIQEVLGVKKILVNSVNLRLYTTCSSTVHV